MTNEMERNMFAFNYELHTFIQITEYFNLSYYKIFYMHQMNPHQANFGRDYEFSRNIVS